MRIFSAFAGIGLTLLIIWAILAGDFGAAGEFLFNKPWGIVTLTDLYLGFLLSAFVIYIVEPDKRVALIWLLPIFVLGNVVTAFWFAFRGLPKLTNSFSK